MSKKTNAIVEKYPDYPKKSLTSYFIFLQDKRADADEKLSQSELSNLWKNLDESKKKKYANKAAKLKSEYEHAIKKFKKKHPDFEDFKKELDIRFPIRTRKGTKSIEYKVVPEPTAPVSGLLKYLNSKKEEVMESKSFTDEEAVDYLASKWTKKSNKSKKVYEVTDEEKNEYKLQQLKYKKYLNAISNKSSKKRKRVDPNAPKKPLSTFFMYQRDVREKYKAKHPEMKSKELVKFIGTKWNSLVDKKKNQYKKKFEELNEKYKEELAEYNKNKPEIEEEEEGSEIELEIVKKKKKKKIDPNMPKKPIGAYFRWFNSHEDKLKKKYYTEGVKYSEFKKKTGEHWRGLSEDKQSKYKKQFNTENEQYKIDIKEYKKNNPVSDDESDEEMVEKKTKKKSKTKKKDPNAPKKPKTAFNLYYDEIKEQFKKENKELKGNKILSAAREQFNLLSEKKINKYEMKHEKLKVQYLVDLREYENKKVDSGSDDDKKSKNDLEEVDSDSDSSSVMSENDVEDSNDSSSDEDGTTTNFNLE